MDTKRETEITPLSVRKLFTINIGYFEMKSVWQAILLFSYVEVKVPRFVRNKLLVEFSFLLSRYLL